MKQIKTQKTGEAAFLTIFVVVVLIILPSLPLGKYGGGAAMVACSIIGMVVYFTAFGKRLRSQGQLRKAAIVAGVSFVLGGAIAVAFALTQGLWH